MKETIQKPHKLIIVGNTAFAEIAYEYFTHDSDYEVASFSVEKEFLRKGFLFDLPVVPFENLDEIYTPSDHSFFVAATYTQKNRLRSRLYIEAKEKGFQPASYISSNAFIWQNCEIGEHCFIFEDNTVQPFVRMGNNVILWSGNHIGHHSLIKDHVFVSSHVVISGFCEIGEYTFMGVNATVSNNITVGNNCTVGAGAIIVDNVPDNKTVTGLWKRDKRR